MINLQDEKSKLMKTNKKFARWIRNPRNKPSETPLVIEGEKYYKKGVRKKLHIGQTLTGEFERLGLLEFERQERQSKKDYLDAKIPSLVKTIALGWDVNPEEVLIREINRKEEISVEEHVHRLCHGYVGTHWFDTFKRRYDRVAKREQTPIIKEWYVIPRSSLDQWLCIDNQYQGMRLCEKGLILPKEESFANRSSNNLIDNFAFASLLAFLNGKSIDDIFLPANKDDFFISLSENFAIDKVIKRLIELKLHPNFEYTSEEATDKLKVSSDKLRSARLNGRLIYKKTDNPQFPKIMGIDLVLYSLRPNEKHILDSREVADLFGLQPKDVPKLHLPTGNKTGYAYQQAVLPLWKTLTDTIRNQFTYTENTLDMKLPGLTRWMMDAQREYRCKLTDLSTVVQPIK